MAAPSFLTASQPVDKTPDAVIDLGFDYSAALDASPTTDTISSAALKVYEVDSGKEVTGAELTAFVESAAGDVSGAVCAFRFKGGTAGKSYYLYSVATTSEGQKLPMVAMLRVKAAFNF